MPIPAWQPNTLYPPGTFVQPTTLPTPTAVPVANPNFETSGANWTSAGPAVWDYPTDGPVPYSGTRVARYGGGGSPNSGTLTSTTEVPVVPGQQIKARCFVYLNNPDIIFGSAHPVMPTGRIVLEWLDALDVVIGSVAGNMVNGPRNTWLESVTGLATAPVAAAAVRVRLEATVEILTQRVSFDAVSWTYTQQTAGTGLLFVAVQTNTGLSALSEPDWPAVAGDTVVDNQVLWEAVTNLPDSVVWEARPILVSGATEPTWPTDSGGRVLDNTISWEAVTRRVLDSRCPNSKVVAIAASKIFAGDNDIIAFSATVNPLDWSTPEDAGYIPFGLQTYGATPLSGLGLYRSNLVAFNSQSFQMWQVDEDPQNHAILDAVPVGCNFHKSIHPVSNDLVFLTEQGIRNIGIAGASTNIQAGFFGKQIDPLVQEKMREAEALGYEPFGLFWPAAGQYWLFFQEEAFILTMNGGKDDMHWSRYIFPEPVEEWALVDDKLVLRAGDKLWEMDDELLDDDVGDYEPGSEVLGYVAWPYLDFGQIGREKQLYGFDLVFEGQAGVSFGYSQTNFALATDPYFLVPEDTLPGQPIPMPLAGPSFQLRLEMESLDAPWEVQAAAIYLQDMRGGT